MVNGNWIVCSIAIYNLYVILLLKQFFWVQPAVFQTDLLPEAQEMCVGLSVSQSVSQLSQAWGARGYSHDSIHHIITCLLILITSANSGCLDAPFHIQTKRIPLKYLQCRGKVIIKFCLCYLNNTLNQFIQVWLHVTLDPSKILVYIRIDNVL